MLGHCVVVTGSNRGLGLEFVRQLIKPASLVVATCRHPENSPELQQLAALNNHKIRIEKLDLRNPADIPNFVKNTSAAIRGAGGLGCLINNAGMAPRAARYSRVTADQMAEAFAVNVTAPLLLARDLLDEFADPGLVLNVSSSLGSIGMNQPGGAGGAPGGQYPYRASKAALNMATRSMAFDFRHRNVSVLAVHPGWVKTRLGGNHAPMEAEQSIASILEFVRDSYDPEIHNGKFVDYSGNEMPF